MGQTAKRKKVNVTPIERTDDGGPECYAILDRLVAADRTDLVDIRIALAWRSGWTVDKDGHLKSGKCCRPNEVSRSLMEFDIVILLNDALWPLLNAMQREELVFHELMHIVVVLDEQGQPKRDQKERIVLRMRKHDIEEFYCVRQRYGEENLNSVAASIMERAERPLLSEPRRRKDRDAA
jgi:hypothetical protein